MLLRKGEKEKSIGLVFAMRKFTSASEASKAVRILPARENNATRQEGMRIYAFCTDVIDLLDC